MWNPFFREFRVIQTEVESKEKHDVCYPMPELTISSPYVHSRIDSNTFTMDNPMSESTVTQSLRVDFNPQSGILDLASANGFQLVQLLYAPQKL